MLAPAISTYSFWSLKLGTFIMVNVLDAFNEILRGDYRLNSCY